VKIGTSLLCKTLFACTALTAASAALAQEPTAGNDAGPEEILVTAQRREENQQRVPVAVSVIAPAQIEQRSNFTALDLPALAPGLNVQAFNGDKNAVSIRGQSFTTGTIYSSVIPYFAEVALTRLSDGLFFDLQNIQVLRGPQGTLFGRVTNGGAILIEPARPTRNFEGFVTQKLGSKDLHTTTAAVNVPVVDDVLSVRFAYERARQDGIVKNVFNGTRVNDTHYDTARLSILFQPSERIENLTILNYQRAKENGSDSRLSFVNRPAVIATLSGLYGAAGAEAAADQLETLFAEQMGRDAEHTAMDGETYHRRKLFYAVNKTSIDLTENITLRNIFGYTWFRQFNCADYDGSTFNFLNICANGLPGNLDDREQFSNELQLVGKAFGDRLDWIVGAYGDLNRNGGPTQTDVTLFGVLRNVGVQTQRAQSRALYGQASYALGGGLEGLRLRGGLRYTWDKVSGASGGYLTLVGGPVPDGQCLDDVSGVTGVISASACLRQKAKEGTLTYSVGIDYQITPRIMVYAKRSRGYRPGGFNLVPEGFPTSYSPEFDLSHEVGLKADWSVGGWRMRTNISAFYDEYTDLQGRVSLADGLRTYSTVVNGQDLIVKGIEVEATVQPVDPLTFVLRYSHALSKNKLGEYSAEYLAAACPADPYITPRDATKVCPLNQLARLPRDTVDLDTTLTFPLGPDSGTLSATASFHYVAAQWSNDTNYLTPDARQKGYSLLDLRATWSEMLGSRFDLTLFCTNVTDTKYIASHGSVSEAGNLGIAQATYGNPRLLGAALTWRFGP
jgi:iron complex outermembrane recepter protein